MDRRRPDSDMGVNRRFDRLVLSTRLALVAGFGGLLMVITLGGIDTIRVLEEIRHNGQQIRQEFLSRNHTLNDIRSNLYLSGTYVRDYLLEPEPERAESYRSTLEQVRTDMDSALESYGSRLDPQESKDYAALKVELARYWDVLGPVLKLNAYERQQKGYAFLRDEVFPRRMAMLDIANRIAAINEQQLNSGNNRDAALLSSFQTRLAVTLAITLILGVALATFSMRRILNLESKAHLQYKDVVEARRQLENLSARLVQAQETERRSLARELHDEVGQALSAVLVELRNLSTDLAVQSEERLSRHLETIKDLVENTVRTIRNMSLLLRPSMLDDLGLIPALRWQAREVSRQTCMDVTVSTDLVSDDLPDEYKTCIYRVVQEALHNCSRHSHATAVRINVLQEPRHLTLSIRDNGRGFDVKQSKGLGLLGIEERAAHLGGKCTIHSEPGSGTVLAIDLPFTQEQNAKASERNSNLVSG
ncbi:MAG TPA: MCP four helix bundle domain-containing protein [Terriglobia bacterium]|nr:MCP four helix bundle domain-containing protein [Terriglobia bacterium]